MTPRPNERPWAVPGSSTEADETSDHAMSRGSEPAPLPGSQGATPSVPPAGSDSVAATLPHRAGAAPAASEGSLVAAGPVAATTPGDHVPQLSLRPMTVADVLDGAFTIIKARPARILGFAASFVVPVYLLAAYVQRNALGGVGLWEVMWSDDPAISATVEDSGGDAELVAAAMTWLVPAVALVFVAAAIAYLVGSWTMGRDATAGELAAVIARRAWALLASFVLVHLLEAVGMLGLYIGAVFVMAFFVATAPAIGAEALGPLAAMKRSASLARRRYWPTLGISLLIGMVSLVLVSALTALPEMIALLIGYDVAWPLLAAGNILGAVVATPFVAAATVLLYLDLRIRSEGLDLTLAGRELFDGRGDRGGE